VYAGGATCSSCPEGTSCSSRGLCARWAWGKLLYLGKFLVFASVPIICVLTYFILSLKRFASVYKE